MSRTFYFYNHAECFLMSEKVYFYNNLQIMTEYRENVGFFYLQLCYAGI